MSKVIVSTTDVTRVTYRDRDGDLADPDTVVAIVKRPNATVGSAGVTITTVSTGVRDIDVATDQIGIWYLEITATGNIAAKVLEKTICVVASSVA